MRSKWKSYYCDPTLLGSQKIWNRSSVITIDFLNKRVLVHNGLRFVSILIREAMLGYKFGEFVITKSLGSKIHSKKKNNCNFFLMGHLVNAKGFRLGNSCFWGGKVSAVSNYFESSNLFYFLSYFIENFFNVKRFKDYGFLYSHIVLKKLPNTNVLDVYLFGGYFDALQFLFSKKQRKVKNISSSLNKELYLKKYIRYCQNLVFNIFEKRLVFDLKAYSVSKVNFFAYSESFVSSEILGRLIVLKLEGLHTINQIVSPIIKDFGSKQSGLALNCSGRFTRKQRAHFVRFRSGSVPFSLISKPIDYFFVSVRLKYGACGIKVWICK